MIFEKGLESVLKGVGGFEQKVFPVKAPQGTELPYMVYRLIKSKPKKTLKDVKGYVEGIYQVDCKNNDFELLIDNMIDIKNQMSQCIHQNIGGTGPYIQNVTFIDRYEQLVENENEYHGIVQCKFVYDPY
ncbi:MAG: hypothetical protein MJA31_15150 [Clostridia bacterium]|nr:hypothetical protein [Clostridia bacterium]